MRISSISFVATSLLAVTVSADPKPQPPTTQACLGNFMALPCPPNARRAGTECRVDEPNHGKGANEHWSGSQRQGPAVFLRDDNEKDPAKIRVSFAANYKDHKKQGRVFHFDADGRLESIADMANDDFHGLSVDCTPEGRVYNLAYFKNGKVVGISRSWRVKDGSFSYAMDQAKHETVPVSPALMARPDELCHPARCELDAKPDLSGIPK